MRLRGSRQGANAASTVTTLTSALTPARLATNRNVTLEMRGVTSFLGYCCNAPKPGTAGMGNDDYSFTAGANDTGPEPTANFNIYFHDINVGDPAVDDRVGGNWITASGHNHRMKLNGINDGLAMAKNCSHRRNDKILPAALQLAANGLGHAGTFLRGWHVVAAQA